MFKEVEKCLFWASSFENLVNKELIERIFIIFLSSADLFQQSVCFFFPEGNVKVVVYDFY